MMPTKPFLLPFLLSLTNKKKLKGKKAMGLNVIQINDKEIFLIDYSSSSAVIMSLLSTSLLDVHCHSYAEIANCATLILSLRNFSFLSLAIERQSSHKIHSHNLHLSLALKNLSNSHAFTEHRRNYPDQGFHLFIKFHSNMLIKCIKILFF